MALETLEKILDAFEAHKELFRLPLTLSYEHDDVTVKYLLSSLKIAETEQQAQIINTFCNRFKADKTELNELLSNPHHWADYLLYTAFAVHCQQQLKLDDEEYFHQVARRTFLDYQDGQIYVARAFPLSAVLLGMPKQFKNWTKVTEVQVERVKLGLNVSLHELDKVLLRRRTIPEYQERLQEVLGEELKKVILRRDCDLTLYAFSTTFQELFGQKDLKVERTHSEANGDEWSEYIVCPSSPYQSLLKKWSSAVGTALLRVFVPWIYYSGLQRDVDTLREDSFEREHTIRTMSEQLEKRNAALQRQKELTVKLLREFSKSRFHGERHSINNRLKRCREEIQGQLYGHMAQEICTFYGLTKSANPYPDYLLELCAQFGVTKVMLNSPPSVREQLGRVKIMVGKKADKSIGFDTPRAEEDLIGLLDDFLEDEIYLDRAFSAAEKVRAKYSPLLAAMNLGVLDPFELFKPMQAIMESSSRITDQLGTIGEVELLDKVRVSEAIQEALSLAQGDKGTRLSLELETRYDPQLYTNHEVFVSTLRDLFYNAVDAKATKVVVWSRSPSDSAPEEHLPFLDLSKFATYPALYLSFKDDGEGITSDKAVQLNAYLEGSVINEKELSTKGKEQKGLGTKNMRDFLYLHNGHCYYEPLEPAGTKVHLYFGRLEI